MSTRLAFKPNDREVAIGAIERLCREAEELMWNGGMEAAEEFNKRRNLRELAHQIIGGIER